MGWRQLLRGGARASRPRWTRAHLLAGLLLGLLGFSLVVQARQTQSENLSSLSQSELVRLLDDVTHKAERLEGDTAKLQQSSQQLRTASDRAAAAEKAARARLEVLGILAGTLPAEGKGITLKIDDPQGVVDDSQLLDTVQELRDAGAEAIQLGSVRVVASTSFVDAPGDGGGVVVDGTTLKPPFEFTVIGESETLSTALDIPGGVLETLSQGQAHGTVRSLNKLTVTAIHQVRQPEFAVPNTGN